MKNLFNSRRGFTLLELLVVVAIIAALAAMLFPFIGSVMERARSAKCSNFLHQIGTAAIRYAGENDTKLPATSHQRRSGVRSWTITLQPYAPARLCFRCPCDENTERLYSYAMNDFLTPNPAGAPELDVARLSRLEHPRQTVLFVEASAAYENIDHLHLSDYLGRAIPPEVFSRQVAVQRHGGAANYVFADGHVQTVSWKDVQAQLQAGDSRFVDPTKEQFP
jgi:prepilin-type N-terminal cleavage/methylation domain-containing protein/prepilin-type processing-associated H-X9-DG protein